MPSLWPFARDDSSPASFEKALSRLSTQITSSSVSLDKTRTRAHRAKAFWTLWSTLVYLVYTALIVLVLGPQQWSLPHYIGLAGTPIVVYGVRRILALYFDWQIARRQGHLDRLVAERDQKIAQLKKATRYDTTQELLNKYGGSMPRAQSGAKQGTKRKVATPKPLEPPQQRTGLSPPPTANIPGRSPQAGSRPSTPARQIPNANSPPPSMTARSPLSTSTSYDLSPDEPGFAPNAFSLPPPPSSSAYAPDQQHRWYDRILDVMLGEDETLAKNRLALICGNCRLVNGQAPPGIRSLEEIGRWRCGSCGAWNGVEKVEQGVGQMMQEMRVKEERGEEGGYGEWMKVSRGDEDDGASPELGTEKGVKEEDQNEDESEDELGDAAKDDVPDSPGSGGSDSGEAEEKEAESVAARVAKTKRGSRRAQKK
ncbi:hypothetical protein EPUS_02300 [Endocarpon pusillum Z07020]|uniref:Endoplasmic reticulum junction formation protein lunapark n=1 Tax=Endocarpon pusillum (strain Z07020 / HMAS-L-300199) TaxID=1263415 RepID=U1GXB7_ENDPU|nr:uncharacterized protein EPUS_02300 [Endocarpon pusillum Z07020]ERF76761.1 hypothetical protein EPUS_02300 [Endocarpon pusillum Z07020]